MSALEIIGKIAVGIVSVAAVLALIIYLAILFYVRWYDGIWSGKGITFVGSDMLIIIGIVIIGLITWFLYTFIGSLAFFLLGAGVLGYFGYVVYMLKRIG